MQSALINRSGEGLHVAIIMDGNGRWAKARRRPRTAGHRAGARAVRRTSEAAVRAGLSTLTLYAFSSDNWKRPASEVGALMRLFEGYLRDQTARCVEHDIRVTIIGRRDRLPGGVVAAIDAAEQATSACAGLHLRLAVDYSSRDAILRSAATLVTADPALLRSREHFARNLNTDGREGAAVPDVDLLIRTGGEQRLSDFLLWEAAYAELFFTPVLWPDFAESDLLAALREFHRRDRRFGGLPGAAVGG
jgi:undecaprenyl diphosphate synthase